MNNICVFLQGQDGRVVSRSRSGLLTFPGSCYSFDSVEASFVRGYLVKLSVRTLQNKSSSLRERDFEFDKLASQCAWVVPYFTGELNALSELPELPQSGFQTRFVSPGSNISHWHVTPPVSIGTDAVARV